MVQLQAGVTQNVTFRSDKRYAPYDFTCPPLVDPWLGEVVGTSLALGKAMGQPLLALGAIWEVIRCSDGAPSAHRVSSRSLTCDTFFSKLNTRTPLFYGNHTAMAMRSLYGCHKKAVSLYSVSKKSGGY